MGFLESHVLIRFRFVCLTSSHVTSKVSITPWGFILHKGQLTPHYPLLNLDVLSCLVPLSGLCIRTKDSQNIQSCRDTREIKP